jgi:hypothetical protein
MIMADVILKLTLIFEDFVLEDFIFKCDHATRLYTIKKLGKGIDFSHAG